jgi:hypothetical protein
MDKTAFLSFKISPTFEGQHIGSIFKCQAVDVSGQYIGPIFTGQAVQEYCKQSTFRDNILVQYSRVKQSKNTVSSRRFGTTYRFKESTSSSGLLTLEDGADSLCRNVGNVRRITSQKSEGLDLRSNTTSA